MRRTLQEKKAFKGTLVKDIVEIIRATPDKPWDEYLSKEAKALLDQMVLPSGWYQYQPVINCIDAVFTLIGDRDPEFIRRVARARGNEMISNVYKSIVKQGNVQETLKSSSIVGERSFFRGTEMALEKISDKHYRITRHDIDPRTEPLVYMVKYWNELLIELAGGKNPRAEIVEKHWERPDKSVIEITWE